MSKQKFSDTSGMTIKTLRFAVVAASFLMLAVVPACENEKTGSLFDPNYSAPRPSPTITSIAPSGGALAAIDTIILNGTGYSQVPGENTVYFDAGTATVVSASSSQLKVLPPVVIGDAIKIKVGVFGAELFSNTMMYKLSPAVESYGNLGPTEMAGAIVPTSTGNLCAAIKPEGGNAKIFVFSSGGVRTQYAPETAGTPQWNSLRFGPGGYLYAARNVRAVYRFAPDGGSAAVLWVAFPVGVFAADLDFDQNQNLWVGGNNTNIYVIRPDATTKTVPFTGNIRSVRVYGGFLYFAASTASGEQIWRAPINADNLGTPEVYFDFSAAFGGSGYIATSITFSSDGSLFIGTNAPESIVIVTPSKTYSTPLRSYASVFGVGTLALAWGTGDALYATTQSGGLVVISTRKTGAPYYGQ